MPPTYTTNTGRVLTAIIFDGTNEAEINALSGFSAVEVVEGRLLVTTTGGSSFYASVGDYIVHTATVFVEIMAPYNFP
jgi:hypothetical protein